MHKDTLWCRHGYFFPLGLQTLESLEEFDTWFDEPIRVEFDPDEQINTLPMWDECKRSGR